MVGACLAETGNHVVCVDVDDSKIARLNAGEIPIYEPGLEALVQKGRESGPEESTGTIRALESTIEALPACSGRYLRPTSS